MQIFKKTGTCLNCIFDRRDKSMNVRLISDQTYGDFFRTIFYPPYKRRQISCGVLGSHFPAVKSLFKAKIE